MLIWAIIWFMLSIASAKILYNEKKEILWIMGLFWGGIFVYPFVLIAVKLADIPEILKKRRLEKYRHIERMKKLEIEHLREANRLISRE